MGIRWEFGGPIPFPRPVRLNEDYAAQARAEPEFTASGRTGPPAVGAASAAGRFQPEADTVNHSARHKFLTRVQICVTLILHYLNAHDVPLGKCRLKKNENLRVNMFLSSGKVLRSAMVGAAGLALMSCQTTQPETSQPVTRLAPMQKPNRLPEGAVIHGVRNGTPSAIEVVKVDGNLTVGKRGDCVFNHDWSHGYFAPEVSWENCNGRSGRHIFHGKSGNIWPLQVGKSETYRATGKTRNTWPAARTCEVEDQVRIKTHIGTHDTFKVVCRTKWATRTSYVSPKIGRTVKSTKRKAHPESRTERVDWELTRVELP